MTTKLTAPSPTSDAALSDEQRAAIAALIGDAKPATGQLLLEMAQQIRDRREHDHSAVADWDWFCLNASGWLGDKAPTVLRRLLDAEAEAERLRLYAEGRQSREEELLAVLGKYNLVDSPEAWDLGMTVIAHLEGPHRPAAPEDLVPGLRALVEQLRSRVAELEADQ